MLLPKNVLELYKQNLQIYDSVFKNVYIDKLDDIFNEYNNT